MGFFHVSWSFYWVHKVLSNIKQHWILTSSLGVLSFFVFFVCLVTCLVFCLHVNLWSCRHINSFIFVSIYFFTLIFFLFWFLNLDSLTLCLSNLLLEPMRPLRPYTLKPDDTRHREIIWSIVEYLLLRKAPRPGHSKLLRQYTLKFTKESFCTHLTRVHMAICTSPNKLKEGLWGPAL